MTELAPILRHIDLVAGLDLALKLRAAGRDRRQARAHRGWATRRDSGRRRQAETEGLGAKPARAAPEEGHRPCSGASLHPRKPA